MVGDTFNFSGHFEGAILNIKTELYDVSQTVNALSGTDDASKAELGELIEQMSRILEATPEARVEQAEAVVETAKQLVEQASQDKPNETMLQMLGDGLKQTAATLADVLPDAVTVATQIVTLIGRIQGG
jgi:ElaB/YqjD/DUF883 family membrane-anchored ribosome-binding protein